MKINFKARAWHTWLSIILVLPLFIVGMTTFFMAHDKALGLKKIAWGSERQELKDLLYGPGGVRLFATKRDVYKLTGGQPELVPALRGVEIRRFEPLPDGSTLASGKDGLWIGTRDGEWRRIHTGDIHVFRVALDRSWHLVEKHSDPLVSTDQGQSWQVDEKALAVMKMLPPGRADLGKLMHDLHTGKALFGKPGEWIWIDVLGLVLVFLTLTGTYIWWKSQKHNS